MAPKASKNARRERMTWCLCRWSLKAIFEEEKTRRKSLSNATKCWLIALFKQNIEHFLAAKEVEEERWKDVAEKLWQASESNHKKE